MNSATATFVLVSCSVFLVITTVSSAEGDAPRSSLIEATRDAGRSILPGVEAITNTHHNTIAEQHSKGTSSETDDEDDVSESISSIGNISSEKDNEDAASGSISLNKPQNDGYAVNHVTLTVRNRSSDSVPDVTITAGDQSYLVLGRTIANSGIHQGLDNSTRERRQLDRQGDARSCTTPSKESGLCKDLADCPDLILDLTNLRRSVCFKSLFVPGVCCPKSDIRRAETTTIRPTTSTTRRPRPTAPRPTARPNNDRFKPRPPFQNNNEISRPDHDTRPSLPHIRCGEARVPQQRVVGGELSPRGKWPWMAAIFLHGPKKTEFWCGASLISSRYVLTAAHCTKDPVGKTFNPQQFTVRLGDHNIFSTQDDHLVDPRTFRVESIRPHPEFKARGFYNDVALIKLTDDVNFNDFALPVCLPPPEMAARELDHLMGQTPTVIGYGSTHYDGEESPVLREAKLPIWRNKECNDAYLQPITEIFLCAGFVEGGKDACQGDSGGPLLLYLPSGQWVQIGIVSFGNRCAEPGYPGVYTRLTQFMPWIHANML